MTELMGDSTSAGDIPQTVSYAAGYVNGAWPSFNDLERTHPGKVHVSIDVNGTRPDADVLDVENGDATPEGAADWVTRKLELKQPDLPVLYVNRSNITAVFNACLAKGHKINEHFRTWIATLDGTRAVADMTGCVAVQYAGEKQTGGHYDLSIVYDTTWKRGGAPVPTPVPVPVPAPEKVVKSIVVTFTDGSAMKWPE